MPDTQTAMTRLKDPMTKLKKAIGGIITNEKALNKSQPKYNPRASYYGENSYSKGVESDFIRIYETSEDKSFAFAFNNIELGVDKTLIIVSTKEGKDIESRVFSYNDVKAKIAEATRTVALLKDLGTLSEESLYLSLDKVFKISDNSDDESTVKGIVSQIKKENRKTAKDLEKAKAESEKLQKDIDADKTLIQSVKDKVKNETEYLKLKEEYAEAMRKFENAKSQVREAENAERKRLGTAAKERKLRENKANAEVLKNKIRFTVDTHTRGYDKAIKEKVQKVLEKQ